MTFCRLLSAVVALVVLAGCAGTPPPPTASGSPDAPIEYLLGAGDQLQITVLGQADLTGAHTVDPSGAISIPLVGRIVAAGTTTRGLEATIAARLGQNYLRDPNVTIQVTQYRPFYILGEVNNAGQYPYSAGLTVQQAVAVAGGFTPRAAQMSVEVVRQTATGTAVLMLQLLDQVYPGDTITVRQRLL
ncbi:MAG: polysaccharide export protein [Bauldia sp.]|nr:polysaccharide export protein [Bauldia sp.]